MRKYGEKSTPSTKPKTSIPDWTLKKILEQNKKALEILNKRM